MNSELKLNLQSKILTSKIITSIGLWQTECFSRYGIQSPFHPRTFLDVYEEVVRFGAQHHGLLSINVSEHDFRLHGVMFRLIQMMSSSTFKC